MRDELVRLEMKLAAGAEQRDKWFRRLAEEAKIAEAEEIAILANGRQARLEAR